MATSAASVVDWRPLVAFYLDEFLEFSGISSEDVDRTEYWAANATAFSATGSWRAKIVGGKLFIKTIRMHAHWAERASVLRMLLLALADGGIPDVDLIYAHADNDPTPPPRRCARQKRRGRPCEPTRRLPLFTNSRDPKSGGIPVPEFTWVGWGAAEPWCIQQRRLDEAADAAREVAIKKCRDLQKLSKNAIFSLHRGQQQKAETQLEQACEGARALLASAETDQQANELRHMGAVKGVMEELLEAKLFAAWLASPGRILHCDPKELGVDATAEEYLGALGDFSGELGRYAVARATARDAASVRVCLGTRLSLQTAALQLGPLWPRGADKKAEALKHASRNMEKLLYEHSLSERTGRRGQQVEWGPEKPEEAALEKEE